MHSKGNSTVLPTESSNNASHGDVYYIAALPPFHSRACLAALGNRNHEIDRYLVAADC